MKPTPTETPCPPANELRRLLRRDLPEAEAARLREHLRDCAACRRIWEGFQEETIASPTPLILHPTADTNGGEPGPAAPRPPSAGPTGAFPFLAPPRETGEVGWLAHYRITGVLGEGGMGYVFDAFDTQLHRRVALKVLKPELAANVSFRERFLQEARAVAALPDEYIITIYQVDVANDVPFLAMKFLHGESLEQRLMHEDRLPLNDVLRIGREIALGLSAAHERGLIHRDIKPANLWLETPPPDQSGGSGARLSCEYVCRVKILDFGLARPINDPRRLTATGLIVGTPSYLAPEQARGQPLDHRCDLFSLGCVLYRMVSSILPFDGPDTLAQLTALATADPKSIEELAPDVPGGLRDLIHQLLKREPAERPATARAVAETLRALEKDNAPTAEFAAVPSAERTARPFRRGARSSSRRRWLAVGAVSLVLLLGGILGWRHFGPVASNDSAALPPAEREPIKVGILFSQSGPMAASGGPSMDAAQLAIDELNQQGGLLGRRIQSFVEDGASKPERFAALAEKLIVADHVHAIFGSRISSNRKAVRDIVEKHDHLLFYPMQFEGLEESPNVVYLGAAPNQQILPAVAYLLGIEGKRRLFLVGSDYVFPRAANVILRDELTQGELARKFPQVQIVGEMYVPFGGTEVGPVIQAIHDLKPDLIVNTINGDTNTAFFRELYQSEIGRERTPVLSLSLGQNDLLSLGDTGVGHYAAWSYFQSIDRPENQAFVRKFRERFGRRHVVSDAMETVYFGIHLWAEAVRAAGSAEPRAVRAKIKGLSFDAPEGKVRIDPETGYTWRVMRLARVTPEGQFEILWNAETPRKPVPFPATRGRDAWEKFLKDLYTGWGNRWLAPR
ncbi:MAG TPA: transporter substrate-binding protein [Gemmataceae bacterium]